LERHHNKGTAEEEGKQDCEIRAFQRLAKQIKKKFPRLPMIILADSLYASEPFMNTCRKNRWDFMIRYKVGSIPSISEEYKAIPEKEEVGQAEFQWLTSLEITKKNEIKKMQKNISSDLLASFARQLIREDIPICDMQSISQT